MEKFYGVKASRGIACGRVLLYKPEALVISPAAGTDKELERLNFGLKRAQSHLEQIYEQAKENLGGDEAEVFAGHLEILNDEDLIQEIQNEISAKRLCAETAALQAYEAEAREMEELESEYMRARAADLRDIGKGLAYAIADIPRPDLSQLVEPQIVIAEDLSPSDTAKMDKAKILGFAIDKGGKTSHVAIMAKSLGIPAVVGMKTITQRLQTGDLVLLDAEEGSLICNPDPQTLSDYEARQKKLQKQAETLALLKDLPAQTLDGHRVELCANIGSIGEIQQPLEHGAEGIGLFRTEFLFMDRSAMPEEEEQFAAYKTLAQSFGRLPVIIRTMDIGGDKTIPYFDIPREENPFLGWRAIRICFDMPKILHTQLRAILRAACFGKLRIMFPMVISHSEVDHLLQILDEAKASLRKDNLPFDEYIEKGIMIETPAAAIIADQVIDKLDFFSIGSNDLTQYTLAVDRGNEKIAHLYNSFHPAVLRLIKKVIDTAHKAGKWVGLCGALAGNEQATMLLVGLGIDELSMSAASLLHVKNIIRRTSYAQCRQLADEVLQLHYAHEVLEHTSLNLDVS